MSLVIVAVVRTIDGGKPAPNLTLSDCEVLSRVIRGDSAGQMIMPEPNSLSGNNDRSVRKQLPRSTGSTWRHDPTTGRPLPYPMHSPRDVISLTLFASGVVPLLVALNWRRLGYNLRALAVLVFAYVGLTLVFLGLINLTGNTTTFLALALVISWLASIVLIVTQRPAYLRWRATSLVEPSFQRFGFYVYCVVNAVLVWVVANVGVDVFLRVQLANTARIESGRVSFSYPAHWTADTSPMACGFIPGLLCVGTVEDRTAKVLILGARDDSLTVMETAAYAEDFWDSFVQDSNGELTLNAVSEEPIDGYDARLYMGTLRRTSARVTSVQLVRIAVIRTSTDEFLMVVADVLAENSSVVTDIIRSIQIEPPEDADGSA